MSEILKGIEKEVYDTKVIDPQTNKAHYYEMKMKVSPTYMNDKLTAISKECCESVSYGIKYFLARMQEIKDEIETSITASPALHDGLSFNLGRRESIILEEIDGRINITINPYFV